ncbi:MAG: protease modulator HflC [Stellaceae bacterium]
MSRRTLLLAGAALIVIIIVALNTFYTVDQTEQALVLQFGQPIQVMRTPGLHVKWPFMQNVVAFDKRLLDVDPPPEEVIGVDQKRIVVDTYTRYRIVNPLLFFQTVGNEDAARDRLAALISSSLRQVIGTVTLSAILSTQRAAIMHRIRDAVKIAAKPFGIDVIDTRLRRADLPTQNSEAIYARMNSERQQQAALYRAEGAQAAQTVRANADRERTVILADAQRDAQKVRGAGDAAAITIYAKAFGQDKKFFAFYRSMQAYRDALSGSKTAFVLTPQGAFFHFFNFNGLNGLGKAPAPASAAAAAPGGVALAKRAPPGPR